MHEPSGIIVRSSARSTSASRRRYRSIWVSEWYWWNTGCSRIAPGAPALPGSGQPALRPSPLPARRHRTPASTASTVAGRRRLVERDAERVGVDQPEVDPPRRAPPAAISLARPGTRTVIVSKNRAVSTSTPPAPEPGRQRGSEVGAPACRDRARSPRARGTARRGRRSPRGAPARCRCCSSPSPAGCAAPGSAARVAAPGRPCAVDRHADESARQRALVCLTRTRGTPRAGRRSRAAHRNVARSRPRCPRRSRPAVAARRARADRRRPSRAPPCACTCSMMSVSSRSAPLEPGYWSSAPKSPASGRSVLGVADDDLEPERLGARLHHRDRLRVAVAVDEERVSRLRREPPAHRHRLGRGGRLVEQRSVREVHAR